MYRSDLEKISFTDPYIAPHFVSVFARDAFLTNYPELLYQGDEYNICIVNSQDSNKPGLHWLLVFQV